MDPGLCTSSLVILPKYQLAALVRSSTGSRVDAACWLGSNRATMAVGSISGAAVLLQSGATDLVAVEGG